MGIKCCILAKRNENREDCKIMTCICGIMQRGTVYIGGDSAGTSQSMEQRIRADEKVFVRGDFLFGICGSFRMGQLLRYTLELPKQKPEQDDMHFLVNQFIDAVKATCPQLDGAFLLGYRGNLYAVHGDFQVGKPKIGFDAVGSGADIAIGALHVSSGRPCVRIRKALEASALNNAAVRSPFHILKLAKRGK